MSRRKYKYRHLRFDADARESLTPVGRLFLLSAKFAQTETKWLY